MSAGYLLEFETHVGGLPCRVGCTAWEPYTPGRTSGPPESCHPAEGGHGEWQLLDRRGRPAPWLARKLTPHDEQRIESELFRAWERRARWLAAED